MTHECKCGCEEAKKNNLVDTEKVNKAVELIKEANVIYQTMTDEEKELFDKGLETIKEK